MKLSIIVPIYGVERLLPRCLDSILSQSFRDYELILVDDGSPDACPRIIDDYATRDPRIVVVHKENGGYSSAMNQGLEIARGEWVGIVEPDDWISPDMYERLFESATPAVDVVKANFAWVHDNGRETVNDWRGYRAPQCPFPIGDAPFFFMEHPSIWTCIYRATFMREHALRFATAKGAAWTDNLFQVQTLYLARKIAYVDAVVYKYGCGTLRNMYTPYLRSHEIHDWLETQGMRDGRLWCFLYRREIAYIAIAFSARDGLFAWARETARLTSRWNRNYLRDVVWSGEEEKSKYLAFVSCPLLWGVSRTLREVVGKIRRRIRRR